MDEQLEAVVAGGAVSHGEAPAHQIATVEALVRRPVPEAWAAFVDPAVLTAFWLSTTSGPLEEGATVHWSFMTRDAESDVVVRTLERDRLVLDWPDGTTSTFLFRSFGDDHTVLRVEEQGFDGSDEEVALRVIDETQGYSIVLNDLKVLLETGRSPNLVRDKAVLIDAGPHRERASAWSGRR